MDGIIRHQRVTNAKRAAAKRLRKNMTVEERRLWGRLRANGLDGLHFRRQQIVLGFIADFYCHRARLVVEVDGSGHIRQAAYDAHRDAVLRAAGLSVFRVSNRDVTGDLERTLARIREAASRTLQTPPLPHRGRGTGG